MSVLGLAEVLGNLNRHAAELLAEQPHALAEGGEVVRAAWVANIEGEGLVDTGAYRDSVRVATDGEQAGVVTDIDYATILEFGDSRQAAHYPATRAADERHDEVLDAVADKLRGALR